MKKTLITLLAASAAIAAVPAVASAQYGQRNDRYYDDRNYGWQDGRDIDERQRNIASRIDRAERNGAITPRESDRLRTEFYNIERLEVQYRRDGLSARERDDLINRLENLARQIRDDRRDGNNGRNDFRAVRERIERQMDGRTRGLSYQELQPIRTEYQATVRQENYYLRADGRIGPQERAELERRYSRIENWIRMERNDNNDWPNHYGW